MSRKHIKPPRVYFHKQQWWADIHYTSLEGKRERWRGNTGCATQSTAEQWAVARKQALSMGDIAASDVTVEQYAEKWVRDREARKLDCAKVDRARLAKYVLPALGKLPVNAVRVRHVRDLVRSLKAKCGTERDKLAPRTVRHIYGTLHTMFHDATVDELTAGNPCILKRDDLPAKLDKDPTWRKTALFDVGESETLLATEGIPADRRVLYAAAILTGQRFGELAALRWRHYDASRKPLGRLLVAYSYNTKAQAEKTTKTEAVREVPVLVPLAAILEEWRKVGWPAMIGRKPTDNDLVFPSRDGANRTNNHTIKKFREDLDRAKLRSRRFHDMRRTFVSLSRAAGADKEVIRWVTHAPPKQDSFDLYTTPQWESVCAEVAKLRILVPVGNLRTLETERRPRKRALSPTGT